MHALNEHALNKIVATYAHFTSRIDRATRSSGRGIKGGVPWAEVFAEAFAMRTNMAAKFKL